MLTVSEHCVVDITASRPITAPAVTAVHGRKLTFRICLQVMTLGDLELTKYRVFYSAGGSARRTLAELMNSGWILRLRPTTSSCWLLT